MRNDTYIVPSMTEVQIGTLRVIANSEIKSNIQSYEVEEL